MDRRPPTPFVDRRPRRVCMPRPPRHQDEPDLRSRTSSAAHRLRAVPASAASIVLAGVFSVVQSCAISNGGAASHPIVPTYAVVPEQEPASPASAPGAQSPASDAPVQEIGGALPPAEPSYPIHGSLSSVFRSRASGGEHDHDVTEVLSLDFGDPARHDWTGHVMARLNGDLDGDTDSPRLNDINDTYDQALVAHLYDAWAEKRNLGAVDHVRLGRQTIWHTPVFAWFDGMSAETKALTSKKMSFGVYGGVPVHLYESSREGDVLAGAWAQAEPWKNGRVRIDWMHPEDDGSFGEHVDNLWRASAWQAFGKTLRVDGWFTGLDGQARDFTARATWAPPESDFTLSATWFELLRAQREHALEFDPYFQTLQELEPYRQVRVVAAKGFGAHVNVQAGFDVRDVTHSEDEGPFNRDFDRMFATATLAELLPGKVDLSVTGETWDAHGNDIDSWGVDLSRRFGQKVRASVGTFYALYKVDAFQVQEREDVRTYYARVRWKRTESTTWDARYEYEDTSLGDFQAVLVGMTWAF